MLVLLLLKVATDLWLIKANDLHNTRTEVCTKFIFLLSEEGSCSLKVGPETGSMTSGIQHANSEHAWGVPWLWGDPVGLQRGAACAFLFLCVWAAASSASRQTLFHKAEAISLVWAHWTATWLLSSFIVPDYCLWTRTLTSMSAFMNINNSEQMLIIAHRNEHFLIILLFLGFCIIKQVALFFLLVKLPHGWWSEVSLLLHSLAVISAWVHLTHSKCHEFQFGLLDGISAVFSCGSLQTITQN